MRKLLIPLVFAISACTPEMTEVEPVDAPEAGEQAVFFAVGRQGYGDDATKQVADSMEAVAAADGNVNFSVLLGDNFYPEGVSSTEDGQWITKFENLYDGPHLRGMPFRIVLGNHDHQGSIEAQIEYSRQDMGTGRWSLEALYYSFDVGETSGQPLARVAVLDAVTCADIGTDGPLETGENPCTEQIDFLRETFQDDNTAPAWKVLATHYSIRSQTGLEYSAKRIMHDLAPVVKELGIDLVISANDRFQQIIDEPGGPLHVGTNGGGRKIEEIATVEEPSKLAISRRGFARIGLDASTLTVTLFDADGQNPIEWKRSRDSQLQARSGTDDQFVTSR